MTYSGSQYQHSGPIKSLTGEKLTALGCIVLCVIILTGDVVLICPLKENKTLIIIKSCITALNTTEFNVVFNLIKKLDLHLKVELSDFYY